MRAGAFSFAPGATIVASRERTDRRSCSVCLSLEESSRACVYIRVLYTHLHRKSQQRARERRNTQHIRSLIKDIHLPAENDSVD